MVRLRPAGVGLGAVGVLESLGLLGWVVVNEREWGLHNLLPILYP